MRVTGCKHLSVFPTAGGDKWLCGKCKKRFFPVADDSDLLGGAAEKDMGWWMGYCARLFRGFGNEVSDRKAEILEYWAGRLLSNERDITED